MEIYELIKLMSGEDKLTDFIIAPLKDGVVDTEKCIVMYVKETEKQVKIKFDSPLISQTIIKPKGINIPSQDIINLYNGLVDRYNSKVDKKHKRSKVTSLDLEAMKNLKGRWNDQSGKYCNLEAWKKVFARVEESKMLMAPTTTWFSLRWMIKPENFSKLVTGRYDDENNQFFIDKLAKEKEALELAEKEERKLNYKPELTEREKELQMRIKRANAE